MGRVSGPLRLFCYLIVLGCCVQFDSTDANPQWRNGKMSSEPFDSMPVKPIMATITEQAEVNLLSTLFSLLLVELSIKLRTFSPVFSWPIKYKQRSNISSVADSRIIQQPRSGVWPPLESGRGSIFLPVQETKQFGLQFCFWQQPNIKLSSAIGQLDVGSGQFDGGIESNGHYDEDGFFQRTNENQIGQNRRQVAVGLHSSVSDQERQHTGIEKLQSASVWSSLLEIGGRFISWRIARTAVRQEAVHSKQSAGSIAFTHSRFRDPLSQTGQQFHPEGLSRDRQWKVRHSGAQRWLEVYCGRSVFQDGRCRILPRAHRCHQIADGIVVGQETT